MSNQDELRGFWASRKTCTPTAQAGDNSNRDTQTGTKKRMAAITSYEKCSILYKDLLAEIKEVPDYNDTDEHTISKGMKKKTNWAKRMRELRLDIVETKNKITEATSQTCILHRHPRAQHPRARHLGFQ